MKITKVTAEKIRLELKKPFKIALGCIESCEAVIVKVETDEGLVGFGEGNPTAFVTGDTAETLIPMVNMLGKAIIGLNPIELGKIHGIMDRLLVGNTCAKAAIDIALHDIMGKRMGMPLYKVLGGYRDSFETDMTISIDEPEVMAGEAAALVKEGYRTLKIKVGTDFEKDVDRIKAIREAAGKDIKIRLDANQGWNVPEGVTAINKMEEFNIDVVEQPIKHWNIGGLAAVRNKVRVPIMADESVFSPEDAIKLIKENAVDAMNIKLMKCGGIFKARRINAIAEAAGCECMVGCMAESSIGITAAASFVAANKNITRADVDSFLMIKESNIEGGVKVKDGIIYLPDEPGLGIRVNM